MTAGLDIWWLLPAGLGAGLSGSVAGMASVVSYPALLAVGLNPLAANVTNTVALVFSGVGSTLGSRPELHGQGPQLRRWAPAAAAGGLVGAVLLLLTPARLFGTLVPVLIGLASLGVLVPRRPAQPGRARSRAWRVRMGAAVFSVAVYGGYFGAAAGVALLAIFLAVAWENLARSTALRNVLLGVANGVAALTFAIAGPVHWWDVLPLAGGFLVGARLGPIVVRRAPAWPLRVAISAGGVALAVHLGLSAY
ncbi:MAG TPA: sulfite exporter TauE/SafE family protein [Acidimicrobiales bacterium]|nr:sulfite exporter TauE/SafE family protein [Acidimicrobiales bacterium]